MPENVLLVFAPGQKSKHINCADDKRKYQTRINSLIPMFVTWCFNLERPIFLLHIDAGQNVKRRNAPV